MIPGEEKIRDILYGWIKEGMQRRIDGKPCKAHPSSLRGMLDITGWVKCDLMLALCRSNPAYCQNQRHANPQLFDENGQVKA